MMRRLGAVAGAFLLFNLSGCALFSLIALPFKLLFGLLGAAGGAVGVAQLDPADGPPPVVRLAGEDRWEVTGLRPEAPCVITCSAPGFESREFQWPRDFRGSDGVVLVALDRKR